MDKLKALTGVTKIVVWTVTGLVIGIAFGQLWHLVDPGLALWFWPVLGTLIFGQHAFRSSRRVRDTDDEEQIPPRG